MACCEETTARAAVGGGAGIYHGILIDEAYEFSAPMFFDFMNGETEDDIKVAEKWFEIGGSYAPSPFMMKIKGSRFAEADGISCDLGGGENATTDINLGIGQDNGQLEKRSQAKEVNVMLTETIPEQQAMDVVMSENPAEPTSKMKPCEDNSMSVSKCELEAAPKHAQARTEACTPKVPTTSSREVAPSESKNQTLKNNDSLVPRSSFTLKPRDILPSAKSSKIAKPKSARFPGVMAAKSPAKIDISHENQAIKKQRLDGGKTREIHNVRNRVLHHKSKPESTSILDVIVATETSTEESIPFMSVAELIKKFESKTREMELPPKCSNSKVQDEKNSTKQMRPKLALTRPKEPELETSHRVRAVRIKSSAELEEEMLAKFPKFKAKPVNKKILEAPAFFAPSRSTPQAPQFQEFHLKTMERALQNAASVSSSMDATCRNQAKVLKLTEPRPPRLETSLRARPTSVKSSQELELEELEKVPKFKAKPLNKRIYESKECKSLFGNPKRQLTIPQEFHFATNERLGPPPAEVVDIFDKLSIHSEQNVQHVPRLTTPNPFNLLTEQRGLEKEKRLFEQLRHKQIEEEKARIPKAQPYPYTTDYPVIPPKPQPKSCTKPDAFMLESLIRHEEELHKKMEEKERMDKEEAQKRIFKAQPILKDDPVPLPEKERRPLTDLQEFVLHVDNRAEHRAEFDKKMKEREMMCKRQREEIEHANMIEEEKAFKQMRKNMVPHARPIPSFANPFVPQKTLKFTKPRSPKFLVAERETRRRQHLR